METWRSRTYKRAILLEQNRDGQKDARLRSLAALHDFAARLDALHNAELKTKVDTSCVKRDDTSMGWLAALSVYNRFVSI